MAVLKNRAKMSTSTTGTGTITLGSAEDGYQTFADAGVANADVVRYVIEDGNNFEIGTGTYTATGTTLSRTVSESSNSNNAINLSGSATVFIGATAEDILSDVVDDTTPQLGGNLDVQTREITTSTTNGNVKLTPNGTGVVEVKGAGGNDGTLQLNCSDNSHGVKIKSPPHSAAASYTLTLPDDDGAASEFLQTDGSGNLSWAAGGGIGGSTGVDFNDNVKARFGNSNDLEIYHSGSGSIIEDTGNGPLHFKGSSTIDFFAGNGEYMAYMVENGAVGLYHDGSQKLNTTSSGIQTTGTVNVNNAYTLPTSDGTNGQVLTTNGSGAVTFANAGGGLSNIVEDTTPQLGGDLDNNNKNIKIGALSTGSGNNRLQVGPNNEFELYQLSIGTYMKESGSGSMRFMASDFKLQNTAGSHEYIVMTDGGSVAISHGNGKKFETTTTGIKTTGTVNVNNAYTLPTSDGTNGQVLTTDGSGAVTFADAGGGGGDPDLYRDNASSATTPVASGTNAVAMGDTAVASGDNAFALGNDTDATGLNSLALGKGAQAVSTRCIAIGLNASASADRAISIGNNGNVVTATYGTSIGSGSNGSGSTVAGSGAVALSNARAGGSDSFAAIIANNTSSYGATGANSIAMGYQCKSSADSSSVALGRQSIASANFSCAIGKGATASATNAFAFCDSATASGFRSVALGRSSTQGISGKHSRGAYIFSSVGDAQEGKYVLLSDTTDATAEALTTTNGAASATNQIILPNNSAYSFSGTIIARESAAAGSDYASWEIKGALLRDANAASTVLGNGIVNKLYATSGASAWAVALTADTTNGGLKVEVTGAAATNIRWVATVNTSEVTYA